MSEKTEFVIKDSGVREQYTSGMVRDTASDKTMWALVFDGPMLKRWAVHLTKGAVKYAKRNWMKASGQAELDRAYDSAARHFAQWINGEVDEDHAAAVIFNINLAEYVKEKLNASEAAKVPGSGTYGGTGSQYSPGVGTCGLSDPASTRQ